MAIVLIKGIQKIDKEKMKQLFNQFLYFTGFELTKKKAERIYPLLAIKSVLHKIQKKIDNLLAKYFGKYQRAQDKKYFRKTKEISHLQSLFHIYCNVIITVHSTTLQSIIITLPSYN